MNNIEQYVENFENKINELKNLKTTLKDEIDNNLNELKEKIENQEKIIRKNLEEKFKIELNKFNNVTKRNEEKSSMDQNKYMRKNYKFSTSYNKQFSENKKDNLFNSYKIKSSKNVIERLKEDKSRTFFKKKTQVFSVRNNSK